MSTTPTQTDSCVTGPDGSCSICGDEAIRGVIESIDSATRMAQVKTAAGSLAVALDLIDDVNMGDTVMVHFGFAIARIDNGSHA